MSKPVMDKKIKPLCEDRSGSKDIFLSKKPNSPLFGHVATANKDFLVFF